MDGKAGGLITRTHEPSRRREAARRRLTREREREREKEGGGEHTNPMLSLGLPSPPLALLGSTLLSASSSAAFSSSHSPPSFLFAHSRRRSSSLVHIGCLGEPSTHNTHEESDGNNYTWRAEEGRAIHGEEGDAPFPSCLKRELMPRHVAVIMDGNGRWAKARGLPASAGHEAGYRTLRKVVTLSRAWGVRTLTVFAFSSENWMRPKAEVGFLLRLFEGVLRQNLEDFVRRGIRLSIIGDSSRLPKSLQELAEKVEGTTSTGGNSSFDLLVAISYSGRSEIVQACKKIAHKVKDGLLEPADITESLMARELETDGIYFPDPDLVIRTSGELRLSNFLLWQSAYSELFFAKPFWPDFGKEDYIEALCSFQQRHRRFGTRGVVES